MNHDCIDIAAVSGGIIVWALALRSRPSSCMQVREENAHMSPLSIPTRAYYGALQAARAQVALQLQTEPNV